MKQKEFECKPECKKPKVEGITFNCDNCIKHMMILLTEKQKKEVLKIISKK